MGFSLLLALSACGPTPTAPAADLAVAQDTTQFVPTRSLAAFPGAEGFGATALSTCDRSGTQVFRVTSLANDGPGTLRDAIESVPGGVLSVIVFDVAGYIDLTSRILITQNCLYIAGQTAPGDGVVVRATGITGFFLRRNVHDVVIRYLTMRGGYGGDRLGNVNIIVGSGHDIVLDHLSVGWTTDKLLMITKYDQDWSMPISNVTLSRSILAEVFAFHPTGLQISGEPRDAPPIDRVDIVHNLFAGNSHRNPNVLSNGVRVMNNVVYNWNQGAAHGQQKSVVDWVSNYFLDGPMTGESFMFEVTYDCRLDQAGYPPDPSYYVQGNVGPHNSDPNATPNLQWEGSSRVTACYYRTSGKPGEPIPETLDARRDTPLPSSPIPVNLISGTSALDDVLGDVGANRRLLCDGTFLEHLDAVDERIIGEVRTRTGVSSPPTTEADVGGFPIINSGIACQDSDNDGMPDAFELRYDFDPSNPGDAGLDRNRNGYTNLEDYLNGVSPN